MCPYLHVNEGAGIPGESLALGVEVLAVGTWAPVQGGGDIVVDGPSRLDQALLGPPRTQPNAARLSDRHFRIRSLASGVIRQPYFNRCIVSSIPKSTEHRV